MKIYRCDHCGNIITFLHATGVPVMCCGQKMTELVPGTVDAAQEKHVPVVEQNDSSVLVKVGAVAHPMLPEHFIQWIILETTGMAYPNNVKKALSESMPELECSIVCLADAKRWKRMQRVEQLAEFSQEQLEGAGAVLVNKSDLVTEEILNEVDASIRTYNADAAIFHVSALQGIPDTVWRQIFGKGGDVHGGA